ncbi:rCG34121 [Rattus norvegicus]|uniref:RCG34121 n=1 Tax=Rattus norvegicus TaxID=10116 RepID=A6HK15_RAT|nr:rCG34121 [Rattus norvegicus]
MSPTWLETKSGEAELSGIFPANI